MPSKDCILQGRWQNAYCTHPDGDRRGGGVATANGGPVVLWRVPAAIVHGAVRAEVLNGRPLIMYRKAPFSNEAALQCASQRPCMRCYHVS